MRDAAGRADTDRDPQDRKMKLASLKEQIARDQYAVDPDAIAEALIRHVCARRRGRAAAQPKRCS